MSPPDMVDDVLFDMVHHALLNHNIGIHLHSCIEIIIVFGGKATHFIGDEVTGDVRYYNSFLMKNPFSQW